MALHGPASAWAGGEGAVAVHSSVCVAVAVEESSFSRAGEWHRGPGHSTGTRNQCWGGCAAAQLLLITREMVVLGGKSHFQVALALG